MNSTSSIANKQPDQYLTDSIRKERMVVITVNGPDGWTSFKSKFLPSSREGETVTVEIMPDDRREIQFRAEPGTDIGDQRRTDLAVVDDAWLRHPDRRDPRNVRLDLTQLVATDELTCHSIGAPPGGQRG